MLIQFLFSLSNVYPPQAPSPRFRANKYVVFDRVYKRWGEELCTVKV